MTILKTLRLFLLLAVATLFSAVHADAETIEQWLPANFTPLYTAMRPVRVTGLSVVPIYHYAMGGAGWEYFILFHAPGTEMPTVGDMTSLGEMLPGIWLMKRFDGEYTDLRPGLQYELPAGHTLWAYSKFGQIRLILTIDPR